MGSSFPSIILWLPKVSEEDRKKKLAMFLKLAEARKAECEKQGEDLDMRFFYVTKDDSGPATQLKRIFKLGDVKDLKVLFTNIPEKACATFTSDADWTEEGLAKMVKSIADETIKTKDMPKPQ